MYKYEMHLHTSEVSKCGECSGKDYIRKYIEKGFDGIFVTDHFYHGNCLLNKNLEWNDWVKQFSKGYYAAKQEGEKLGLKVFFGFEERFEDDEYLVYGLDENWLLKHPEILNTTRKQFYELCREGGGCVVQAHPFRQAFWLNSIWLNSCYVDAVEAVNTHNRTTNENVLATLYAKKYNHVMTAGSDVHKLAHITNNEGCMFFEQPLNSAKQYADIILEKNQPVINLPDLSNPKSIIGNYNINVIEENETYRLSKKELINWLLKKC